MKNNQTENKKTSISTSSEKRVVVHQANSDIEINKSDLILYLIDFKNSIQNKRKVEVLISFANTAFILSVFFTSNFKTLGVFSGAFIRGIYIVFAAIIIYDLFLKVSKKDDSEYKTDDAKNMALIIEDNCKKKK